MPILLFKVQLSIQCVELIQLQLILAFIQRKLWKNIYFWQRSFFSGTIQLKLLKYQNKIWVGSQISILINLLFCSNLRIFLRKYQIFIISRFNFFFMQGQQSPTKSVKSPQLNKKKSAASLTPEDFTIKYTLGRGAYGNVFLVERNSDKKLYAMKQIQKRKLEKEKKQYQALIEKEILTALKHPAVIKLHYAFQDKKCLYFVVEWCEGGQFLSFIKINIDQLSEQIKRFYIAQIVNILQYLHKNGVTHRDVKPENLMLSSTGHLKIIDFGTAQITKCTLLSNSFKEKIEKMKQKAKKQSSELQLMQDNQEEQSPRKKQRRSTFVGSCYYLSPQLLEQNYCPPEADLWALGCIIYQLYYLQTPFKDNYEFAVYQKIKKCQVQFPKNKDITENAIDLIKKLLKKNPDERLGSGKTPELSYQKLKQHPFFEGLNVDTVFEQPVPQIQELKQPQIQEHRKSQFQEKKLKSKTQFARDVLLKFNPKASEQQLRKVLIHGLVQKKTFLKYSYYYLIVYEDLTIERIKSDDIERKKYLKINLNSINNPAKFVEKGKFQLTTTEKTYFFKCQDDAQNWVQTINKRFLHLISKH